MGLKLGLHTPDFHRKGKKDLIIFSLLCPRDAKKESICQTSLGAARFRGMAKLVYQEQSQAQDAGLS